MMKNVFPFQVTVIYRTFFYWTFVVFKSLPTHKSPINFQRQKKNINEDLETSSLYFKIIFPFCFD